MTFPLVGDVLYIILNILADQRDYNSLYQCAITSRCFTEPALQVLQRNSSTLEPSDFLTRTSVTLAAIDDVQIYSIRKWAKMWRSIVMSALEYMYLPYYTYIHYLDLEGLEFLLCVLYHEDEKEAFFTPEIDDYLSHEYEMKGNRRLRSSSKSFDKDFVLFAISSAIVKRLTSIKGMACNAYPVQPSMLEFLQRLPSLQTLRIWSGSCLTDHVVDKIRNHCPDLKNIIIRGWYSEPPIDGDATLENFLNKLRPNTLEHYEVLNCSQQGPRSIRALSSHWDSLAVLSLDRLRTTAVAELVSLSAPPALKVLALSNTVWIRDEAPPQPIDQVADWIRRCKTLQQLELVHFTDDDPFLLAKVLPEESLHLSSLSLKDYWIHTASPFHEALHKHPSLRYLHLNGQGSDEPEHNESLIQGISQLPNLRGLKLEGVSSGFIMEDFMALTPHLPHLERLWIDGKYFCNRIWNALLCLPKLKGLTIAGRSAFKGKDILDFIDQLGPGNRGFRLSILKSTDDTDINDITEHLVRDHLRSKLNGYFDFDWAEEEEYETEEEADFDDDMSE
ncbi:hypothetical protein BDV32DRAFT_148687 [Aspergillus pseudonomiae]|nr:hypothetical protein BDV32DRAFT_148687 [Aspergillus pseudonomiae]